MFHKIVTDALKYVNDLEKKVFTFYLKYCSPTKLYFCTYIFVIYGNWEMTVSDVRKGGT